MGRGRTREFSHPNCCCCTDKEARTTWSSLLLQAVVRAPENHPHLGLLRSRSSHASNHTMRLTSSPTGKEHSRVAQTQYVRSAETALPLNLRPNHHEEHQKSGNVIAGRRNNPGPATGAMSENTNPEKHAPAVFPADPPPAAQLKTTSSQPLFCLL